MLNHLLFEWPAGAGAPFASASDLARLIARLSENSITEDAVLKALSNAMGKPTAVNPNFAAAILNACVERAKAWSPVTREAWISKVRESLPAGDVKQESKRRGRQPFKCTTPALYEQLLSDALLARSHSLTGITGDHLLNSQTRSLMLLMCSQLGLIQGLTVIDDLYVGRLDNIPSDQDKTTYTLCFGYEHEAADFLIELHNAASHFDTRAGKSNLLQKKQDVMSAMQRAESDDRLRVYQVPAEYTVFPMYVLNPSSEQRSGFVFFFDQGSLQMLALPADALLRWRKELYDRFEDLALRAEAGIHGAVKRVRISSVPRFAESFEEFSRSQNS